MSADLQKTILVVDDEEEVSEFLSMALEDAGFAVMTARDGKEGLEAIRKQTPDLISLDLVMPKHSGAKMFHELKRDKNWSRIPVLIVTGHARDDLGRADFQELTMSGPGVYLEKPVKPKEYVNAVKSILHMDVGEVPSGETGAPELRNELKSLIDDASEDDLRHALAVLRDKKP